MLTEPADKRVAALLPKLRAQRVTYFPIRHHSPACAAHLRRLILARRPAMVLIEGPASFTAKIDLLTDPRCVCPVALYTTFIDKTGRLHPDADKTDPPRFAAYYPFCDYSPELIALRTGREVGARLGFIDLEYAEMILARHTALRRDAEPVRVESLAADPHLRHSEYVAALARRLGCRDFNEVWDHLFESGADALDTDAFIDRVAAYCAMARFDYTPEVLTADGTTAREACMAGAISDALRATDGSILVVTGGLHTVALPDLVAAGTARPAPLTLGEGEGGTWLMRYSFDQLDALAGYASGMPSPAYYDRLWHAANENRDRVTAAADLILEIGRLTRERRLPVPITTPDAIAAVQMARQLAAMRGHAWPLREDVLDGIRASFVKGEIGTEGRPLLMLVHEVFAGKRIGQVPPDAGQPPIVDDFHRAARLYRLPIESVERREVTLDLYRSARDRAVSRLLLRLGYLGAPFATLVSGPDFVHGHGLDLIQERWQVTWSPATESALIEAAVFGSTVEEATAARLGHELTHLEDAGRGRSTAAAVETLVRACRLGLHRQVARIVPLIDVHIAEDPAFPSVVDGLSQLELLGHAREPLEATDLTDLPRLMTAAYQRACRLLGDTAACPDDVIEAVIGSLRMLREILAAGTGLDAELFHRGLARVIAHPADRAQAAVVGAAAGILYGDGVLAEPELIRLVHGYLGGALRDPRKSCGIVRGLLATAREIAWQVTEVARALDARLAAWDEAGFLAALPELRLAFTDLTPQEIARVAGHVAALHGETTLGELVHAGIDEEEVRFGLELTRQVREALRSERL